MIEAKSSILSPRTDFGNYFIARDNIVPVTKLDYNSVLEQSNDDELFTEPEIIRESETQIATPQFKKFFDRVFRYVDNLENLFNTLKDQTFKFTTQKKIRLETEKTDQQIKKYQAKRLLKQYSEEEEEREDSTVNLTDNPELSGKIAAALGLGVAAATGMAALQPGQIPSVYYEPVAGQLVPKGTSGVSGYPITSSFGTRWGTLHGGVDVGVPIGTMFAVKAKSQVVYAGWQDPTNSKKGYGLLVDVWVPTIKQMIRFGHLSSVAVKVGDQIEAGKVLGKSGSTGRSTGPHFHIEAHDTVTPLYGSKDPTPYLGYVILGDTIQQRSEGAVEGAGRIMVGEADPEFVVPASQIFNFAKAMIEEKIKCLNPLYQQSPDDFAYDIPTTTGTVNKTFASGGISGGSPEFWQMVAISATEDIRHPQGQADVAQSIYNRVAVGSYPGGKNITKIIVADGQYQPTFKNPAQWLSIKDRKTAITATKILPYVGQKAPALIDSAARAITNPSLQQEAARFVGGRTDFMGESQKSSMESDDITRGKDHNFFGWFYDARLPKAAPIHPSVKSMTNAVSKPQAPTPTKKGLNFIDKFMLWINPSKKEKASLNNIDQSLQMEIAKETQNQFSFENVTNEIISFYKPTVYYPEEVA